MIDIIIPVYNEENNLNKLMGSLCAQTKDRGFMVTVVNDQSTDRSVEILNRWKEFVHFPMQILTPEEKLTYPGLVRQYGIYRTRCEYIMFCDGDDELLPHAVEYLTDAIRKTNSDVVSSRFIVETDLKDDKEKDIKDGGFTWLHGNIYRRKFLEDNDIRFYSGYNEDGAFNLRCLLYGANIVELKKSTYIWKNNKKSITRSIEEDYVIKYMDDVIGNYIDVYNEINERLMGFDRDSILFLNESFSTINKTEKRNEKEATLFKYLMNCLGHLSLFYQWYNTFIFKNVDLDTCGRYIELCKRFVRDTGLYSLLNDQRVSDKIKIGFAKKNDKIALITVNEFFRLLDIYCDLRPDTVIEKFGGWVR